MIEIITISASIVTLVTFAFQCIKFLKDKFKHKKK